MALSFSNELVSRYRGVKVIASEVTLDATYAAGGYAITAANFNLAGIKKVLPFPIASAGNTGFVGQWDKTNSKLKVLKTGVADAPLNEAAVNQANLTGVVMQVLVFGY